MEISYREKYRLHRPPKTYIIQMVLKLGIDVFMQTFQEAVVRLASADGSILTSQRHIICTDHSIYGFGVAEHANLIQAACGT